MPIYAGVAREAIRESALVPSRALRTYQLPALSGSAIDASVARSSGAAFERVVSMCFDEVVLPKVKARPAAEDDSEYW
ncbi:hypothetical protein Back2_16640 [Nocardioides baekrokdamisoli]|uniref:Uncharacterized protein n=1 Tax=Nocardioides baekrokdamisoli TaxID=1804624 RepID=A0A3G9IEN5_9ACTN|nr:hypothetical protein Back2_16640 [Nocardioides baekrokdamisoli]